MVYNRAAAGIRVSAQISNITLRKELLASENANSVIYLAWEHAYLNQFAKRLLKAYGKDPSLVPDWPNDEYDRIYVFRIKDVDGRFQIDVLKLRS
jgi:hypothetical protein